jgi:hypothetical protein
MTTIEQADGFVLRSLFTGGATSVPNRISEASSPYIARCLVAGLLIATRETLTLTEAGRASVAARKPQ